MLHLFTCHGRIMPHLAELLLVVMDTHSGEVTQLCQKWFCQNGFVSRLERDLTLGAYS